MGSQGVGSNGARTQTQEPKLNPLASHGSLSILTLDEVKNQLGDLGKPLSSMNLDELLKTSWSAESNNQAVEGADFGPTVQQPGQQIPSSSLNRQSSPTPLRDLSKKTVDEVWQDFQQRQKKNGLDRKATLGEITLEDFLVKAGIVVELSPGEKSLGSVVGPVDPMALRRQVQWTHYQFPSNSPQQQQQQNMLPVFALGHSLQQPNPIGGNSVVDTAYPEAQITMSPSTLMGTLLDTEAPGGKRDASDGAVEKNVERRQKRMIKNRESAARSRARKLAYTNELENKVSRLEEENERLRGQTDAGKTKYTWMTSSVYLHPASVPLCEKDRHVASSFPRVFLPHSIPTAQPVNNSKNLKIHDSPVYQSSTIVLKTVIQKHLAETSVHEILVAYGHLGISNYFIPP
ncbi:unnamed protein product [Fraxinus pennsylvanica]|uniref:BZIP domain-containing protein n=1 Tax=Fraxinus pennsylvanica TaxID=56036 RepID=A0AAD2A1B8_9LAMI|nr:unnamed protein product [Fraxinus pennsylvanica]